MRKAKNRNRSEIDTKSKKMDQRCELCGGYDVALAADLMRGKIKWICYNCYRKGKEQ